MNIITITQGLAIGQIQTLGKGGKMKKLRGMTASHGKYKGIAKIVLTNEDISKVKEGEVLVSVVVNSSTVVMTRAKAIVCDEGRFLSHATVALRELGIPCVIGTKIATRVLKDGDLVEVDASRKKGIVKIHKQGEL